MVEMCEGSKQFSVNLRSMHVFPTPESPSISSLNSTSYCLAMTSDYNGGEGMSTAHRHTLGSRRSFFLLGGSSGSDSELESDPPSKADTALPLRLVYKLLSEE
ncbi:hypothetical protein EYF80_002475 [Liparis tanakae]|uniref:Uncharacterized protein n=1 Tax=Liparis tanakae TaxID=230148 RepID=A0A4Z2JBY9_9TELE|nr:hypothetical protein EYF80_002475 [Liparis tanakae]